MLLCSLSHFPTLRVRRTHIYLPVLEALVATNATLLKYMMKTLQLLAAAAAAAAVTVFATGESTEASFRRLSTGSRNSFIPPPDYGLTNHSVLSTPQGTKANRSTSATG